METIYLKTLGKLTIKNKLEKGFVFKEIPEKIFPLKYIQDNKITQEEYNRSNLTTFDLNQAMNDRGIRYIYHFTSVNNLSSILKKGFIPRCFLKDKKMENNFLKDFINASLSELNDYNRFDGLPETTNFSISCINLYLLKEYQKRFNDRTYCILKLNKDLILQMYNKGEYFFYHNASSVMFSGDKSKYKKVQSFNKMFYDNLMIITNSYNRLETRDLEGRFTTSLQADVMITGFLSAKNIIEIIFNTEQERQNFLENILTDVNLIERVRPITKVDPKIFEIQRYEA